MKKNIVDNKVWAVCCPGPSIHTHKTYKQIQFDNPSRIIAVNCAIFTVFFKNIDYWVMSDIEMFESCYRRHLDCESTEILSTLLVSERWVKDIPTDYDYINSFFNSFKKETFLYNSATIFPLINKKISKWYNYSIFISIAEAIKRGATDIFVYGADMGGDKYFKTGFSNGRTRHNKERWIEEKNIFNIIRLECLKHGIRIIRR
ncbi:MAG: hypothetical protein KAQ99_08625 [Candidatus Aureabacteria bacterium]|nr:hypothetical protein [Candidatus Auribacterota bacterium]